MQILAHKVCTSVHQVLGRMFSTVKMQFRHFISLDECHRSIFTTYIVLLQLLWTRRPMGGLTQSPLGSDNLVLGLDNLVKARQEILAMFSILLSQWHCTGLYIHWVELP